MCLYACHSPSTTRGPTSPPGTRTAGCSSGTRTAGRSLLLLVSLVGFLDRSTALSSGWATKAAAGGAGQAGRGRREALVSLTTPSQWFTNFASFVSFAGGTKGPANGGRASAAAWSEEHRGLAAAKFESGEEGSRKRIDQLIDLLVAETAPFDESSLGGGLWVSVYDRGAREPRWRSLAKLLEGTVQLGGLRNLSGQSYDVANGRVLNYSEVLGQRLFITAKGNFRPAGGKAEDGGGGGAVKDGSVRRKRMPKLRCPVVYDVEIDGGSIEALGLRLALPIQGPGFLRCLFADENSRIFISPGNSPDKWEEAGLVVVQVPAGPEILGARISRGWRQPRAEY